ERRYILAPVGLNVGDTILASASADIKAGNALPMANIPVGTVIHNIELYPGKGAQLVRSAGVAAQLMAKENDEVNIRYSSGATRKFCITRGTMVTCVAFTQGVPLSNRDEQRKADAHGNAEPGVSRCVRCQSDSTRFGAGRSHGFRCSVSAGVEAHVGRDGGARAGGRGCE
ncbi:MAG: hypothetical protein IKG22_08470, partial [Atopobiaceae bacterium]|nr:hypothetical protein [Atopobiaceae bacterium]